MSLRNITLTEGLPYKVPQIEDITDQLPKRQSWETLPKKQNIVRGVWDGTYHTGLRNPEDIDTIVIHHSASPEGSLYTHANNHGKNWGAGIGYHIAIDNGRIYQVNDLLTFSFHVSGHNTYTVGIEVNRDISKGDLTSQERELLYAAILSVKAVLPIKHILGHIELNKTACPCTSMNQIRDDILKIEKQMEYAKSRNGQEAMAYNIAQTILWTYNTAKGLDQYGKPTVPEEGKDWARQRLLLLEPVMREHGFLQ
jgi:hypothetical protein